MNASAFRQARREQHLTQAEAAARLGVSQSYVALLEQGKRTLSSSLARKAARLLRYPAAIIPCTQRLRTGGGNTLPQSLSALGYPGYCHLRAGWKRNPAEVLVEALQQEDLDARTAEALPWLLVNHPTLDDAWLLREVLLRGLTNRLGFFVSLTLRALAQRGQQDAPVYRSLQELETALERHRLAAESSMAPHLSLAQQDWLRQNRPEDARRWNILTTWRPEHLPYV